MGDERVPWSTYATYVVVILGLAYAWPAVLSGSGAPAFPYLPGVQSYVPSVVGSLLAPEHGGGDRRAAPPREIPPPSARSARATEVSVVAEARPTTSRRRERPRVIKKGRPVYPSGYVAGGRVKVVIPEVEGAVPAGVERQVAPLAFGACTAFGSWEKVSLVNVIPDGSCARYRSVLVEEAGPAVAPAQTVVRRDDSTPPPPRVTISESSANASVVGDTLFYRASERESGTFTVVVEAEDPESGIASITLPSLGDTASATQEGERAAATYAWSAGAGDLPAEGTVVTTNGAGAQSEDSVRLVPDPDAPDGGSISYAGGLHTDGLVPISLDPGHDLASGVDDDAAVVEMKRRRLVQGRCRGSWRDWEVAPADGSPGRPACVRFRYRVSDGVGNERTYGSGVVARVVDSVSPSAVVVDPLDGATLSGPVTVSADVEDVAFGVAWARFEFTPLKPRCHQRWRVIGITTAGPYRAAWDTSALEAGTYRVRVVAADYAGNAVESVPVTVTLEAPAEPPLPPDDEDGDGDGDGPQPPPEPATDTGLADGADGGGDVAEADEPTEPSAGLPALDGDAAEVEDPEDEAAFEEVSDAAADETPAAEDAEPLTSVSAGRSGSLTGA